MRVFIGGVMQGSMQEMAIGDQVYRQTIQQMVRDRHPDVEIVDPYALFPDSMEYDDDHARQVFFSMVEEAARADVVIAYLPEASMGTALEMVRAYDAGTPVVAISPLSANWFIRFLSQAIFPTLEAFRDWVEVGGLEAIVKELSALQSSDYDGTQINADLR